MSGQRLSNARHTTTCDVFENAQQSDGGSQTEDPRARPPGHIRQQPPSGARARRVGVGARAATSPSLSQRMDNSSKQQRH